jgi:hypothetical protein
LNAQISSSLQNAEAGDKGVRPTVFSMDGEMLRDFLLLQLVGRRMRLGLGLGLAEISWQPECSMT